MADGKVVRLLPAFAAFLSAFTACAPFEANDPRVGEFHGSFRVGQIQPLGVDLTVMADGTLMFATGLENIVSTGTKPVQLGGGSREFHFENTRNSRGTLLFYKVDAVLLPGDQVIEGTVSYWTQESGQTQRKEGLADVPFRVRRAKYDSGFVQTTPGDFSCASRFAYVPPSTGLDPPDAASQALIPKPSCFGGALVAATLSPIGSANYLLYGVTPGGDPGRSVALFSACDGRELACKYVDPVDAASGGSPTRHGIVLDLTEFQEVLVVSEGDRNALKVTWCATSPTMFVRCW